MRRPLRLLSLAVIVVGCGGSDKGPTGTSGVTTGTITASPTTVAANGLATTTLTVTLLNSSGAGVAGKSVAIGQGSGKSQVTAASSATTNSAGQVTFTATNAFIEQVTYTATDASDNFNVPGSVLVSYVATGCAAATETAQAGWTVSSPVTGFAVSSNCVGISGTAWDAAGNLWAMDYGSGNLYKFPASSGVASAATLIGNVPVARCPHGLTFSKDRQHLYLAEQFCGNGGDVVELSMTNAAIIKQVAPAGSIGCATGIATDPISGDLFVTTPCPGGGTENVYRVANPTSVTPTVSVYSSPGRALGLNFTSDGTLWIETFGFVPPACTFSQGPPQAQVRYIAKIAGTNTASPGACTLLSAVPNTSGVVPARNTANPGNPPYVLMSGNGVTMKLDLTVTPPVVSNVATGGSPGNILINGGPDGCAYVSNGDRIDKIAPSSGGCTLQPSLLILPKSPH